MVVVQRVKRKKQVIQTFNIKPFDVVYRALESNLANGVFG
jgi:hypothetical protein